MADQRILYTEEMVGSGHPTKTDTLNRLALVEHENDGTHQYVTLSKQTSGQTTDADQIGLFNKAKALWIKLSNDGSERELVDENGNIVGAPATPGDKMGFDVDYASAGTLTVTTGRLEVGDALYENTSAVTVTPINPANDTWYGLKFISGNYVDTVSAACFEQCLISSFSYSDAKHGWYCGDDRVVGLFHTDGSGNIEQHRVVNGWWRFISESVSMPGTFLDTSSPPQTFTAISCGLPALSKRLIVEVAGYAYKAGTQPQLSIANGDSSPTSVDRQYPTEIVSNAQSGYSATGAGVRATNTSGQIKYFCVTSGMAVKLGLRAFKMPRGM